MPPLTDYPADAELGAAMRAIEAHPESPDELRRRAAEATANDVSRVFWKQPLTRYPAAICTDCAQAAGGRMPSGHMATFWTDTCPVCERETSVAGLNDFCHPPLEAINRVRAGMG